MRVLLVEDDTTHANFILQGLKEAGHVADHANTGIEGLYYASEVQYNVMIIDRMLPKLDGLTVIETLRKSHNTTPILILSALSRVEERIKGLRAGADDYLTKPFEFGELMARIEALVRRGAPTQQAQTTLQVGDLQMNLLTRVVTRQEQPIDLQSKEFQLLEFLMRRPDQVVTRTMLLEGVWDFHFSPNTNLIDAQMSKLRLKIDKPFNKALIKTIKGAGYKITVHD